MRWLACVCVLLIAGCASPPAEEAPGGGNATAPTSPADDAADEEAAAPEMPRAMERFVLQADRTLGVLRPEDGEMPVANVPELLRATAFYESFAQDLALAPWSTEPFATAWETNGEVEVRLSFTSSAAAVSPNPRAAGFPPVGGWFGTPERFAHFVLAEDAPDTLEAGRVYTVTLRVTPPDGGFFVRAGESLALHTFLSYQASDGSAVQYVVGGPEPAGFLLPHRHFDLVAPRATVLLDEAGELGPNAGPTGDMQQTPAMHPFVVPEDVLFVVMEVTGAPKAGTRLDVDLRALGTAGERLAEGSGPGSAEVVVLGPGNLAASGRDLVAQVVNAANPSGATYALKVTAYSP